MIDKEPVVRDNISLDKPPQGWETMMEYLDKKRDEIQKIYKEEGTHRIVYFPDQYRKMLKDMRDNEQFICGQDYYIGPPPRRGKRPFIYSPQMLELAYQRIMRRQFSRKFD